MTENYTIRMTFSANDQASQRLRQVNTEVRTLKREGKDAAGSVRDTGTALDKMASVAAKVGLVFAAMKMGQAVADIVNFGREVEAVRIRFGGMVDSFGGGEEVLQKLRSATRDVVTDMELMRGASKVMELGLGETSDEMARIMEIAVGLGDQLRPAGENIERFSQLLATQSIRQLSAFGISAEDVRKKIDALLDSGRAATRDEAFRMAVLEVGSQQLDAFGDAAWGAHGAISRLETRFENFRQGFAEFAAGIAESAATSFEQLVQIAGWLLQDPEGVLRAATGENVVAARARDAMLAEVEASVEAALNGVEARLRPRFDSLIGDLADQIKDPENFRIDRALLDALDLFQNSPELAAVVESGLGLDFIETADAAAMAAFNITPEMQQAAMDFIDFFLGTYSHMMPDDVEEWWNVMDVFLVSAAGAMQPYTEAVAAATETIEAYDAGLLSAADAAAEMIEATEDLTASMERFNNRGYHNPAVAAWEREMAWMNSMERVFIEKHQAMFGEVSDMWHDANRQTFMGEFIFDPAAVSGVELRADALRSSYEQIARLAEESELIGDVEVARAEELANQAARFAEEARKGADAFERMSLSDLFGREDGGRLGQLTDLILANVTDPTMRAELEQQFALETGRETKVGIEFEERFAPLLARISEEMGVPAAMEATRAALAALEAGRLTGAGDADIIAAVEAAIGYRMVDTTTAGPTIIVAPGDTVSGLAGQYGLTPDEIMAITGITNPRLLQPGTYETETGGSMLMPIEDLAALETSMTSIATSAADFETSIAASSDTFTPFLTDLDTARTEIDEMTTDLEELDGLELTAKLVLELIMNDQTGTSLASNPAFARAIQTVVQRNGGTVPGSIP